MTIPVGTVEGWGRRALYKGIAGVNDNDVVLETNDLSQYDKFVFMSTAGAWDILVSLDGTNYVTAPVSMTDMGATATAPVIVAAAARLYGLGAPIKTLKVLQNGATAVANFRMMAKMEAH